MALSSVGSGFGNQQPSIRLIWCTPFLPADPWALTVIPAYFIGKTLFKPMGSLVALASWRYSGEILGRSILDFDHHSSRDLFQCNGDDVCDFGFNKKSEGALS